MYIVATLLPCQKAGGQLLSSPKAAKAEDHGWLQGGHELSHFRRGNKGMKVFFFASASPKRGRSSATVLPPTVPCQQFQSALPHHTPRPLSSHGTIYELERSILQTPVTTLASRLAGGLAGWLAASHC